MITRLMIVLWIVACMIIGGYLHGFVYYPMRWPHMASPETFDLSAVLMGAFLGYFFGILVVMTTWFIMDD